MGRFLCWHASPSHSQVRLLTAGAYMLAGVRADLLTGGSLAEKLKHMATDDGMKAFMERATKGKDGEGFWLIHGEVGTLVIVPAGYIIVNAGVTSASDVRWDF